MFFLAWPDFYEAQKWKWSHRTESIGHRRTNPGQWHLPGIMPVSSAGIRVCQSGPPPRLVRADNGEQDLGVLGYRIFWRDLVLAGSISSSLRKQWVLSLWPRKASLNRQPCTEAGCHQLLHFLFPHSHARKASFNPGDEHFLFSLFFLFPPTPQSSQWWRVKGRVKGVGWVGVYTKPFPPAGAGGCLGWLSVLCFLVTMSCVRLRKQWQKATESQLSSNTLYPPTFSCPASFLIFLSLSVDQRDDVVVDDLSRDVLAGRVWAFHLHA